MGARRATLCALIIAEITTVAWGFDKNLQHPGCDWHSQCPGGETYLGNYGSGPTQFCAKKCKRGECEREKKVCQSCCDCDDKKHPSAIAISCSKYCKDAMSTCGDGPEYEYEYYYYYGDGDYNYDFGPSPVDMCGSEGGFMFYDEKSGSCSIDMAKIASASMAKDASSPFKLSVEDGACTMTPQTPSPTAHPTKAPTGFPTVFPTLSPSAAPSMAPSTAPTGSPTMSPIVITSIPTVQPTTPTAVDPCAARNVVAVKKKDARKYPHRSTGFTGKWKFYFCGNWNSAKRRSEPHPTCTLEAVKPSKYPRKWMGLDWAQDFYSMKCVTPGHEGTSSSDPEPIPPSLSPTESSEDVVGGDGRTLEERSEFCSSASPKGNGYECRKKKIYRGACWWGRNGGKLGCFAKTNEKAKLKG